MSGSASQITPGSDGIPIAPSASEDLPGGICKAILVGSGGTLDVVMESGETRLGMPAVSGYFLFRVKRVLPTSTASDLWAMY